MQLPNEVWTLVLIQIARNWEDRWKLAQVCRQWKQIICFYPWEEALSIAGRRDTWPPFYNVRSIRIESEISVALLEGIHMRYLNIRKLEFAMFSTRCIPNFDTILEYIKQFEIDEIIIGTASSLLSSKNFHFLASCTSCDLSNCINIQNNDIRCLKNCISLNLSLKLSFMSKDDQITDENISYLSNLTSFDMSGRKKISDKGLKHLTNLIHLKVNHSKVIGTSFQFLSKLQHLSYHRCALLDSKNLSYLNLYSVDLTRSAISNETLEHFATTIEITLNYCTGISGRGLASLKSVKILNLDGCKQLVDNSMKQISQTCEKVSLRFCDKLTDKTLKYLAFIGTINIKSCPKISYKGTQQTVQGQIIFSDFDHQIRAR